VEAGCFSLKEIKAILKQIAGTNFFFYFKKMKNLKFCRDSHLFPSRYLFVGNSCGGRVGLPLLAVADNG
jgi:hypothetical protein